MSYRNPYYQADQSHHAPEGFRNTDPATNIGGDFQRWRRERSEQKLPRPPAVGYEAFAHAWWTPADFTPPGDNTQQTRVWWLGHASVLLRLDGRHVLTDPLFSQRASPLSFAGPKRRVPVPARIEDLPKIDVVLISHSHYDHLDRASVKALAKRNADTVFLVPLGLAALMRRFGCQHVIELDWWQSTTQAGLDFHFVPAQHWSARSLWDRNRTLWGGWTATLPGATPWRFYFAGDTGYSKELAQIAEHVGPIDLAALPIGAYAPRWFMQNQHIGPVEAVRLHRELRVRQSFGIHWGAFELADESLDEPPALLRSSLAEAGLSEDDFWLLKQGESRAL